jgi:hypothetical protein
MADNLSGAKNNKDDEFYTTFNFVQNEINAYLDYNRDVFKGKTVLLPCDDPEWSNFTKFFQLNFERLKLKSLISTSFAPELKGTELSIRSQLERNSTKFDAEKSKVNGKIFRVNKIDKRRFGAGTIEWDYLDGNGSFASEEVSALRDEADIVITNPPFSLFRDFVDWIFEGKNSFLIIGPTTAITYQNLFPRIQRNEIWLGKQSGQAEFATPENLSPENGQIDFEGPLRKFGNIEWFTNLDHARRHNELDLITMAENIRFNRFVPESGYVKYDNYDAIEIPRVDAIPSDYSGVMGVPISFLSKHNPQQFEILGSTQRGCHDAVPDFKKYDGYLEYKPDGTPTGSTGAKTNENANVVGNDGKKNYFMHKNGHVVQSKFQRLFIRKTGISDADKV